jgi:hypothetical protein
MSMSNFGVLRQLAPAGAAPPAGARAYLARAEDDRRLGRTQLECEFGQRPDERLGLAADRLVCVGEADTEGEWINVGYGGRCGVADVPPDRLDSARDAPRAKPSCNEINSAPCDILHIARAATVAC